MRKIVGDFKDKVASNFKTNTPKDYGKQIVCERGKKLNKPKAQKQSEENIIKSIRNLFKLKKKMKQLKIAKDRIIRDIKTIFYKKIIKSRKFLE